MFTIRPDGRDLRVVEETSGFYEPRWSPDGRELALSRDFAEIWLCAANGSLSRRVSTGSDAAAGIRDQSPAWFPDGTRVVFVRSLPPPPNAAGSYRTSLWTLTLAGRREKRLLAPPRRAGPPDRANVVSPEISHNGRWIAFNDVTDHLWLAQSNGTGRRRLGVSSLVGREPRWSPDDTRLAFLDINAGPALRILNLARNHVVTVPTSTAVLGASWSPDGRWLAIAEARDYQCDDPSGCQDFELWISNPTGTRSRRIFQSPYGELYGLDWSR